MRAWRVPARIAQHEWRVLSSEITPWMVFLLLAVSVAYGVANGVRWVSFQTTTIRGALDEQAQRYGGLKQQVVEIQSGKQRAPFADPRMPDMAGGRLAWTYAAMPPLPTSPLSIGQSDVLPYYFKVSTAARESVLTTSEIENPHRLLNGRFDLSFIVIYLFPLLIIALGYNVISAEREHGTLGLLLSQPVALRTFLAAKIGVRAGLVVFLVIFFALLGMVVDGVQLASYGTIARLIIWAGIVVAYGVFWCGAVLLVAAFGRGSAANAMALGGLWLLLVVVVPSALNMSVSALYPMPSRVDMIAALRVASNDASAKGNQLLAKYYGDHPELVAETDARQAMNDVAVTQLAINEDVERRVRPVVDRYDVQLARQQGAIDRFRLLSPAIVTQDALNDVAGTGAARYRHFVSLVEAYHQGWQALFASMIVGKRTLTPAAYDALPRFQHLEESSTAVVLRTGAALAWLVAAGAGLAAIGILRLHTSPVAG